MKKLSILLILALLLSFVACQNNSEPETAAPTTEPTQTTAAPTETTVPETTVPETTVPETVTLYIPETVSICDANGTAMVTMNYVFEEGWQDKETFTATYSGEGDTAQAMGSMMSVTYSDKCVITDMQGISRVEVYLDENGRTVRQTVTYANNASMEKLESTMTYDEHGRVLTQENRTYAPGAEEPTVQTQTYTYTDTDTGSKGTWTEGGITYERQYDANYRCTATVTVANDQETSRTESTYDEYGNVVSETAYAGGQRIMITNTTYTAVEVSVETAARLPQFDRSK